MKSHIYYKHSQALLAFVKNICEKETDIIFVCSHSKKNAEIIVFDEDKDVFYMNPKEQIDFRIMLKFLGERYDSFVVYKSELLTIPDVKKINKYLGDNVTFFGVYYHPETKEKHKSSYYLNRLYGGD